MRILTVLTILASLQAKAGQTEYVHCTEFLSGDTMTCDFRNGGFKIVHVAGVEAPVKGQKGFYEAKNELEKLVGNSEVELLILASEKSHLVAGVYLNNSVAQKLVASCTAFYRREDALPSSEGASIAIAEDSCRFKHQGVFINGNDYARPNQYAASGLDEMKQQRINGTADSKVVDDWGRPKITNDGDYKKWLREQK